MLLFLASKSPGEPGWDERKRWMVINKERVFKPFSESKQLLGRNEIFTRRSSIYYLRAYLSRANWPNFSRQVRSSKIFSLTRTVVVKTTFTNTRGLQVDNSKKLNMCKNRQNEINIW